MVLQGLRRMTKKEEIPSEFRAARSILAGFAWLRDEVGKMGLKPSPRMSPTVQRILDTATKMVHDPYFILGVERGAPLELVKAVWKEKAKYYHPDSTKLAGGRPELFKKLKEAYEAILRDIG